MGRRGVLLKDKQRNEKREIVERAALKRRR
jgi:hypothetical protein